MAKVEKNDISQTIASNSLLSFGWSLLKFENPFESGVAFAVINFTLFSIYFYEYTLASLKLVFISTFLTVCGSWAVVSLFGKKNQAHPNPLRGNLEFVSQLRYSSSDINGILQLTVGNFLNVISTAASLQYPFYTIKALTAAFHLYILGLYIPLEIVLLIGTWFAFAAPTVYRLQKAKIDPIYELVVARYNQYTGLVISKIPPGIRSKLKIE